VSLLPFKHDLMLFKDLPNMYSDCQEFLDLGGGDYEEHAILLANFFIYIDEKYYPGRFKTYLVYGYSMPEGKNVFVMRKFANPVEEYHKI
jgi:coiled-coil and C2 domain-containing protein 2A